MGAEIAAYSKKAYEDSMATAKELTACKSVTEFFEKQTAFGKTSIEGFVAEATRLNEMYAAAAKEAFAPLNARFTAAVEMAKDAASDPASGPDRRKRGLRPPFLFSSFQYIVQAGAAARKP